jgi:primosomal replication protein N''
MAAAVRFCPNCNTERPLEEFYCNGEIDGSPCNWDLSSAPIQDGGRPVLTPVQASGPAPTGVVCINGHPITAGDLI